MRVAGLPRLRASALAICLAAVAVGLSGCGSSSTGSDNDAVTVSGSTLTIWAAQPPGDSGGQTATDVLDAEKLAFSQSGKTIDGYHLRMHVAHQEEVSADARQAVSDKTAIAYLGEIEPGTSDVSVQITNEVGLLEVSPTDTAAYLTEGQVKDSPGHLFPAHANFGMTFARVVPSSLVEAKAIVARMKSDGVSALTVADDGTPYGLTVAGEVRAAAAAAGITIGSGGAYFYAGLPGPAARTRLDAAAAAGDSRLYAPSALYDAQFVSGLSSAAQQALTVSVPGIAASALDSVGQQFVASFRSRYGHAPAPPAIFGYEAMRAVVASLQEAGSHASVRQVVVGDFRDLHRSASVSALGAYTIKGGDSNLAASFEFARVSGDTLVVRAAG